MSDTITLTEWISQQQGAVVAVVFLLLLALAIWRDVLVTGGRHREAVADRDWWRDEASRRERELEVDAQHRQRVISAIEMMADMLQTLMSDQQRQWFSRWRI